MSILQKMNESTIAELEERLQSIKTVYVIICTVTDTILLILISCTIVRLAIASKRPTIKKGMGIPVIVVIQLVLLLVTYILFSVKIWWKVVHGEMIIDGEPKYPGVIICYLVACTLFMIQHVLYIAQYVRVASFIPLTFCVQTPTI